MTGMYIDISHISLKYITYSTITGKSFNDKFLNVFEIQF